MTLSELIKRLQELEAEAGDLLVFSIHGATGVSNSLSTPTIDRRSEYDQGDTLDLDMGEKYVSIYAGN